MYRCLRVQVLTKKYRWRMNRAVFPSISCLECSTMTACCHIERHTFGETLDYKYISSLFFFLFDKLCLTCTLIFIQNTRSDITCFSLSFITHILLLIHSLNFNLIHIVCQLLLDLDGLLKRLMIDQMLIAEVHFVWLRGVSIVHLKKGKVVRATI